MGELTAVNLRERSPPQILHVDYIFFFFNNFKTSTYLNLKTHAKTQIIFRLKSIQLHITGKFAAKQLA